MNKPQYNPKYTTCMNMKSAFEQGKEAQKQDELIIWQNGFKEGKKLAIKEVLEIIDKLTEEDFIDCDDFEQHILIIKSKLKAQLEEKKNE